MRIKRLDILLYALDEIKRDRSGTIITKDMLAEVLDVTERSIYFCPSKIIKFPMKSPVSFPAHS